MRYYQIVRRGQTNVKVEIVIMISVEISKPYLSSANPYILKFDSFKVSTTGNLILTLPSLIIMLHGDV